MLKGYFDDSRTEGRVWTLAGYVGDEDQWAAFEYFWPMVLDRHNKPYFHLKEMADPNGPFREWMENTPDAVNAKAAFFAGLVNVLRVCQLQPFGATVRIPDLDRFNRETNAGIRPYPLAAYGCWLELGQKYQGIPVEMVFDRVEKVESKLATAREYADSDTFHTGVCDHLVAIPLPPKLTFRDIKPIQAADFAAWELRKNHLTHDEWFAIEDKPIEWDARLAHFKNWCLEKYGTALPPSRISFLELFTMNKPEGIVWDYRAIRIAHEARGGVWSL